VTSRELTGLLSLRESDPTLSFTRKANDWAWRLTFGAIGWPWLLKSLHGGSKADKRALMTALGLAPDSLPHLGSWKADTGFLRHIVMHIARLRPAVTVELGAGASTLVAAKAMALHGGGTLISFDQHAGFVEATRKWLDENGLKVDIRHAPLEANIEGWPGRWYSVDRLPDRIDLIIIDGPPWSVHPLVRGAADSLFRRLTPGGVILLDDAARPGERLVARRWRKRWPDIDFALLHDGTKGTLVGVKRAAGVPPAPATDAGRPLRHVLRAAGVAALIAIGWIGRGALGEFPEPAQANSRFIDEAAASHRTSLLRQAMVSQVESTNLDSGEIARSTGIHLPALPKGWRVRDVQLYPAEGTPAVALSLDTPQKEAVTLLAGRAETPAEAIPLVTRRQGENIAYWENGDQAFALTGTINAKRALELAAMLAGNAPAR
jgi:predicted O-methyltransferase YrrM/anti-sigma factor RsiW